MPVEQVVNQVAAQPQLGLGDARQLVCELHREYYGAVLEGEHERAARPRPSGSTSATSSSTSLRGWASVVSGCRGAAGDPPGWRR